MPRDFALGDVLTITTGLPVAKTGIVAVYEILNYMTDDNLFTNQLPRAAAECRPHIVARYPLLASASVDGETEELRGSLLGVTDRTERERLVAEFVRVLEWAYGAALELSPIPERDHAVIGPLIEAEMMTDAKVILFIPGQ